MTEANTKMPEKIETASPSTPCVQCALTRNRCSICLSDLGDKALFATLPKCRHPSRGLCFVGSADSVVAVIPAAAMLALSIRPRRSLAQHEDPGGTGRRRIGTASEKDDNE